jgi:HAD superfamily hydrolase (TIGR01509 family)
MSLPRLRAIIFDFNGVIADDEAPHFLCFRQALAEEGLELTKEEYYGFYQGMDERNCAAALLAIADDDDPVRLQRILERKAALFRNYEKTQKPPLFAGVVRFVKEAATRYRLAIASGGRREQIVYALQDTPIEQDLTIIVSAEDVATGKPDPAIYCLTLARINETAKPSIKPDECLVIEDSLAGIQAARAANMKVVAMATTYPAQRLGSADMVFGSFERIACQPLEALFSRPASANSR